MAPKRGGTASPQSRIRRIVGWNGCSGHRVASSRNAQLSFRCPVVGPFPATGCPAFRLKARVQLSDVVKERQGGESPTRRFRQRGARRRFQAVADDGQLQHSREHRRHVHGVMSERMKLAALLVGLAPKLGASGTDPLRYRHRAHAVVTTEQGGHTQLHVRRPDFRLLRAITVDIGVDSALPKRAGNAIRQQNRCCTPLFNPSDRREGRWRR